MAALTGRQVIEYASGATSKSLTISSNALPMYQPGVQVTLSSLQVVDITPSSLSKAVSQSSGAIKASAGTLFSWLATTSGDIDIKDGNTSIARIAITAGVATNLGPWGIPFSTSISISASAAVATFVFK